ncbi:MAG TPA: amino acid ABC transporter substrate-binding protein [Candidatus Izemoplasmatales bacterium]|nr:amino acid ABC transporter substrate-binding protein [Candidatus Izemoplasmatales bacterium]
MKKILGFMLLGFISIVFVGCQNDVINTWDEIEERGYFIVGLDDTFAPMGFRNNDGELVGFDVDLAKEVSERLGVDVRFQPIDWDAKVLELNGGSIDMIWNGLTITDARQEEMLFSNAYIANTQMIMVQSGANIDVMNDLVDMRVGVQVSSAAEESVLANEINEDFSELLKYDTYNLALLELENGTIDAVVVDEIMGRYIISQNPGTYQAATDNFGEEAYGVGFRLESEDIRDTINQVLSEMIGDGTASEISIRWFDEDIFLT